MQIIPSTALLPYIKHYLFLESEKKSIKKLRLFSDGNTGMVFSFSNNLIALQNNEFTNYLPASFVYGQINEFKDLYVLNQASLVIVVFQPAGINRLLGIPAAELRDTIIDTADLFGREGLNLQDQLLGQSTTQGKLKILNTFFTRWVANKTLPSQLLIEASLHFILTNKGTNSIHQLVKHTGYTERHLERRFMECIGLRPKQLVNIVKLHHFLKLVKAMSRQNNLTKICYEAGYADQSHLIKEFRKYTGLTPKEYLRHSTRLTSNFIELSASSPIHSAMSDLYNFPAEPSATFVHHLKI